MEACFVQMKMQFPSSPRHPFPSVSETHVGLLSRTGEKQLSMQHAPLWLGENAGLQDIELYLLIIRNHEHRHVSATFISESVVEKNKKIH